MAEFVAGSSGPGEPQVVELDSVPGFIVFDLPGAAMSAGGTRLAPDVTAGEVALLARAMTYKFAALGEQIGGAKAGLAAEPANGAERAELLARYCAEIGPMADAGQFLTGPDMGTSEEDFAPLRKQRAAPSAVRAVVDGVPFEDLLTGFGVVVAAQTALAGPDGGLAGRSPAVAGGLADRSPAVAGGLAGRSPAAAGGLAGRTVAIEGFGKVGGGVAREVARRSGQVVAVSTVVGYIHDPGGLDVGRLLALRRVHGDECVARYGLPVGPPAQLFTTVDADVIVPGARPGAINEQTAAALPPSVRVLAPAANAPYTAAGADVLRRRGITALPDFVCNAGAVIGYRSAPEATPEQVLADVEARIGQLIRQALRHPGGPLTGACEQAAGFLRTWWGEPPGPPLSRD